MTLQPGINVDDLTTECCSRFDQTNGINVNNDPKAGYNADILKLCLISHVLPRMSLTENRKSTLVKMTNQNYGNNEDMITKESGKI